VETGGLGEIGTRAAGGGDQNQRQQTRLERNREILIFIDYK